MIYFVAVFNQQNAIFCGSF